jgi:hypothetical protein
VRNDQQIIRESNFYKKKIFWWYWGLNSGLYAREMGALLPVPYLQPFWSGYFGDRFSFFA